MNSPAALLGLVVLMLLLLLLRLMLRQAHGAQGQAGLVMQACHQALKCAALVLAQAP